MACSAGAVGGAVAVASMNDSIHEDEVVDNIKYTICGILASPLFEEKAILKRSLKVWVKHPVAHLSVYMLKQMYQVPKHSAKGALEHNNYMSQNSAKLNRPTVNMWLHRSVG